MDALTFAQRTRAFFRALFGSRLMVQTLAELDEARRERDYFRGRCERLEMKREAELERLTTPPPAKERVHGNPAPIPTVKTFEQLKRQKIQENMERAKADLKKKLEKAAAN